MNFLKKNKLTVVGIFIGGLGGYLYHHFAGCNVCVNGSCAIRSSAINSAIFGAVMIGLLFSTFQKENSEKA